MSKLRRRALPFSICFCFVVLAVQVWAQRGAPRRSTNAEIQVRVTYENDRPVSMQLRIELISEAGIPISQAFTDSDGRASFRITSIGNYRVRVSGNDVEDAVSEPVQIDQDGSRMLYVRVKQKAGNVASTGTSGNGPVTSAAELRVPQDARKAFDKGLSAWQKKDYQKAAEAFEKAVTIYPEYDTAYNNLGVMYAHLNEVDKAMAAFERSVQLNDKNPDADRNLARMLLRHKDFVRAEDLLKKSLTVQPMNPGSLTMLSIAEIENGHVDEALADARKVHDVPHDGYALSHFVAGQALERKHQYPEAAAEYTVYLRESPNGPEVQQVKSALNRLSTSNSTPPPNAQ